MRRTSWFRPAPLAVTIGLLAACGGGDDEDESAEFSTVSDAADQMRAAVEGMTEGEPVEPVDFRSLRDRMEEEEAGFTRVSAEGQRSGAMGMSVSTATAHYERGDASIEVTLTDLGGVAGPAMMGMAAWAAAEIDRETENGYERTTRFDGHPAYEKFTRSGGDLGRAELAVLYDRRFLLQLEGQRVDMDMLHDLAEAIDLDDLDDN